ncbi:Uncharacterized protein HZ326_8054 [Fusarium oxysporum f. sp. albedinis]|nr:Uncharacterized protein HZ326_8054 [Fusarium oxysporum f. sp. albedinis]KAK2479132.1 hypothetical protein H9L39_08506 [Fusarium oxysporum f. sp. albedinis]
MELEYKTPYDTNLPIYKHCIPGKLVIDETEFDEAVVDIFGAWDFKFVNRHDATEDMITVETNDKKSIDLKKDLQEKGVLKQD